MENGGPKRLLCKADHQKRILAAGKEQHRPFELRSHLTQDKDRFVFELV